MRRANWLLLSSAGCTLALTQQCHNGPVNEGGNYFCGNVAHLLYEGLRGNGQYDAVATMDSSGRCDFVSKTYSGPLAPLDEGVGQLRPFVPSSQLLTRSSFPFTFVAPFISRRLPSTHLLATEGVFIGALTSINIILIRCRRGRTW